MATDVPLLMSESTMIMWGAGITTVHFFTSSSQSAATFLKDRLLQVVKANPWLSGTLVQDASTKQHGRHVVLRYSKEDDPSIDTLFAVDSAMQLSEGMTYADMHKAVETSGAHVVSGKTLLNKPLPICKLTIAPAADGGGFAVIFSMSHVVGDGATYFALLKMLISGCEPQSLEVERKHEMIDKAPEITGKNWHTLKMGIATLFHMLGGGCRKRCCGTRLRLASFQIDDEKVKAAIAEAQKIPGAPEKLSTNDVLTSGFGNLCMPRMLTMLVDYRRIFEGLTPLHAGNYSAYALFGGPGSYGTPCMIRESVAGPLPFSRGEPPSFVQAVVMKRALISNWATLWPDVYSIPDCTQARSLPIVDIVSQDDFVTIFRSGPGQVAAIMGFVGRQLSVNQIAAHLPIGKVLYYE